MIRRLIQSLRNRRGLGNTAFPKDRGRKTRAGFSLVEVLIVLAIIALVAALVGPRVFAQLDRSKVRAASVQISALRSALGTLRLEIGRYPTGDEGLDLLVRADPAVVTGWYGPYLDDGVPMDPWGRPYVYVAPATPDAEPQVLSLGADGEVGGEGLNADIGGRSGNAADASREP